MFENTVFLPGVSEMGKANVVVEGLMKQYVLRPLGGVHCARDFYSSPQPP